MPGPRPVTLITGASSGIGAALAHEFASHGHELVLVARGETQLAAVADAIVQRGYARPHVFATDLTQPGATDRVAAMLHKAGLEPQFVVNDAGARLFGPATTLDRAGQLATIDLNVRGLTELSLRFAGSLERHRGGILNVGSVAGFMPRPGAAIYHATKAYVLSFSEALHRELAPTGVRVTALCPGPVQAEPGPGVQAGLLSRMLMRSASVVARAGYYRLMRGQRVVVPGAPNRLVTMLPRLLPRRLMLALTRASNRHLRH
jgi:short-subunit dehydrogenase